MELKPKFTPNELVSKLKSKGVSFYNVSDEEAAEHLKDHNNYFRLASYRKNYDKHDSGKNEESISILIFPILQNCLLSICI